MAQDPNAGNETQGRHKEAPSSFARVQGTVFQREAVEPLRQKLRVPAMAPESLLKSGDPMLVLKALLKMPEQWNSWGFRLRHISGLELELRAGFANFTENSSLSFPMSLMESFILGRRVNSLLKQIAGCSFGCPASDGASAISHVCRSMYKDCAAWDVAHGSAQHRESGVDVWFCEDDLSVAGFTERSSIRFELGLLQRWRLWRAARFLSRRQAANDLATSFYRLHH
jgi:hypothetical protein